MTADLLAHNVVAHWLQAGLLAGVAGLGVAALRIRRPDFLLRFWQAVLLLLLVAPWIQPWQPVAAAPTGVLAPISGMEQAVESGDGVSVAGRVIALPAARWRVDPWTWALGLLSAGVIVRLGWIGLGLLRLARLARAAARIAPPAVARELLARFRVSAVFVQHPEVRMPCSFGLFRPTVMLPAAFDRLEPAFQRAIICHELLHIERRDFARVVVEDVAAALLWFHPWVWLLRRRIRLHREQVVDAAVVRGTGDRRAYVRCLVEVAGHPLALRLASPMLRSTELRARADALFEKEGAMSTRRSAVVATGLCVALGATVWMAAATVPLNAAAPGGALQATSAGQPAAQVRHAIVLDFTLPGGHQPQIRGLEGQRMRIWLRDAGRLGFVASIRDDAQEVVTVTVIDLDSVPERELGTVDIAVGGDPVTFQTSVPFQIAVPRIVTFDPVAAARLRAQEIQRSREQMGPAFQQLVQAAAAIREFRPVAELREAEITQERIAVMVEQLRQAVASMSDLLAGGDTTAGESSRRLAALNMRVAELQMMVGRLQTQLQEVGVPER